VLAIRLDNPNDSARWYPGGGLYRNVWLTKTAPVHVAHWGTRIVTPEVSADAATVELSVTIDNDSDRERQLVVASEIYELAPDGKRGDRPVSSFGEQMTTIPGGTAREINTVVRIDRPRLWGPPPTQAPNLYVAVTRLLQGEVEIDRYETRFGVRELRFGADDGLFVNGERIEIRGVNQHHDLGALGAAFNLRAAERQLQLLREMGANAIRTAHNPPAPELLDLTDGMGFLVVDEIFDVWERQKTPQDFHRIFPDWHEADLRAFIRRDRNHPSVIVWSVGNEVGEQYEGEAGAAIGERLHQIVKEEDATRPTAASMNYARPHMPFAAVMDTINLNYQGEGIRDAPAYAGLEGITTPPLYSAFHEAFPDKLILSSENAAALSTRGAYLFPVEPGNSAPVREGQGGDEALMQVSAYELYTAPFGSSADKVFASLESHPFVAGGFVWSGWDYLGEPTPYYGARSSYFGVIDLAGFPKDRFFLYQSQWRPELPMAHILPHWNWPERIGKVTPVHVFTSGDEAELFLNGESLGRKKKRDLEYRLRWDDVVYEPGRLEVVAYRNGEKWASASVQTAGDAAKLELQPDRNAIRADGRDLSFVAVKVVDEAGRFVPRAGNEISFTVDGPGEIVATDNGDPTSFIPFPSASRPAFNGRALVIVRAKPNEPGRIVVTATAEGLQQGVTYVDSN
jgi:beta-galactosidase